MQKLAKPLITAICAIGAVSFAGSATLAGEEHGHCSGAIVCAGDAACEKQGWKELTKDECAKIDGSTFDASTHAGEEHSDPPHDVRK